MMPQQRRRSRGGAIAGSWDAFNPADKEASITLSNGDSTATINTVSASWRSVRGVTGKSSGKPYFEYYIDVMVQTAAHDIMVGVATSSPSLGNWLAVGSFGWQYTDQGAKGHSGSLVAHGATFTQGDTVGVALDLDAGKIWFSVNGTFVGDPGAGTGEAFSGVAGTLYAGVSLWKGSGQSDKAVTFVSDPADLIYSAPSGFTAGWSQ